MNLTPEQAGKMFDLKEKFHTDTASLRKQMMVKRAELRTLWAAENPDKKQIQAKQKEINTLKGQMQEKVTIFRLEAVRSPPSLRLGMRLGHGGYRLWHGPGGRYGSRWRHGPRRWRGGNRRWARATGAAS